jgi:hypothetical protein
MPELSKPPKEAAISLESRYPEITPITEETQKAKADWQ